ncbi:MAG: hypothetical protein ACTSUP_03020 [Candidatus Heimdallarchaeaceae archaeon]
MEFGDKGIAYSKLIRRHTYNKAGTICKWQPRKFNAPKKVLFIGWRTLSDGVIDYDYDEEGVDVFYVGQKYFQAFLVVETSGRTNPFCCLPEQFERV